MPTKSHAELEAENEELRATLVHAWNWFSDKRELNEAETEALRTLLKNAMERHGIGVVEG